MSQCVHRRVRLGPAIPIAHPRHADRLALYQWGFCLSCGELLERLTELREPPPWQLFRGKLPRPAVDTNDSAA